MLNFLCKTVLSLGLLTSSILVSVKAYAITIIPSGYEVEEVSTGSFQLVQPGGLTTDNNDNLYIARNFYNGTSDILKITTSGDVSSIATLNSFIGGLALNNRGELFGSLENGNVFQVDKNTVSIVSNFGTTLSTPVLEGLTFDNMNNLFVTQLGRGGFQTGTVFELSNEGTTTIVADGLIGPRDVKFVNGSLFIADSSRILERTSSGNITTFFGQIPGEIIDFGYDIKSNSFFFGGFIGDKVDVLSNGQVSTFAEGFDGFARTLTFDSQENLYVADATKLYRIRRVSVPESVSTLGLLMFGGIGAVLALVTAPARKKSQLYQKNHVSPTN
ncbi:MAG: hypothetical protein DSM106950_00275 [Stigonema ocellatum SAG 48.90 = DSM 106950]|nr:hypothetical protein [Stigonema ocellatum SAG 48.90 = DSM 106950]